MGLCHLSRLPLPFYQQKLMNPDYSIASLSVYYTFYIPSQREFHNSLNYFEIYVMNVQSSRQIPYRFSLGVTDLWTLKYYTRVWNCHITDILNSLWCHKYLWRRHFQELNIRWSSIIYYCCFAKFDRFHLFVFFHFFLGVSLRCLTFYFFVSFPLLSSLL